MSLPAVICNLSAAFAKAVGGETMLATRRSNDAPGVRHLFLPPKAFLLSTDSRGPAVHGFGWSLRCGGDVALSI